MGKDIMHLSDKWKTHEVGNLLWSKPHILLLTNQQKSSFLKGRKKGQMQTKVTANLNHVNLLDDLNPS